MATGFPVKANYATGDVLTAANMNDLSGTVNYLQYMTPRNPILNSNFSCWQRGTSFAVSANAYVADRFQAGRSGGGLTISRQSVSDTTNLPNVQYVMRVQRDSGNASATPAYICQSLETVNSIPFAGKQVTLSFYARAGANLSGTFNIYLITGTGIDQNRLSGSYTGDNLAISMTPTFTTTMTRYSATATLPSNMSEMAFFITWTPSGTAGANDYFDMTGIQIELGSVANTYMPNQPTYQGELAACQRYLPAFTGPNSAIVGYAYGTNTSLFNIPFAVTARTAPTGVTLVGAASAYALNTPTSVTPAYSVASINNCQVTASHTIIAGQGAQLVIGGTLLFTGCEL